MYQSVNISRSQYIDISGGLAPEASRGAGELVRASVGRCFVAVVVAHAAVGAAVFGVIWLGWFVAFWSARFRRIDGLRLSELEA